MKRCPLAAYGLIVLMGLGSGCGQKPEEVPASKVDISKVGGNQRLKPPSDDFKKLIGKDGRVLMKPGMKIPPRTGR